jgi:electron transfer flavoprotein alpha subunit
VAIAEFMLGKLDPTTYELISIGRRIANSFNMELCVVMMGADLDEQVNELLNKGPDKIVVCDHPLLKNYTDIYAEVLYGILKELKPTLILLAHSFTGMDLAPALAARLGCPVVTNCTNLLVEGGRLIPVRIMHGGKIWVKVEMENGGQLIVTLQKGAIKPMELTQPLKASIIRRNVEIMEGKIKFVRIIEPEPTEVDIAKADRIVAAGRGVGDRSGLKLVEELANALNATLACSRPLVDLGWLPPQRQVGLSGKTVKPKLYIACGISGASQHIVGMKNSGIIVAINKDPNAPIFNYSDYAVVGDLRELIPALIREVRSSKQ